MQRKNRKSGGQEEIATDSVGRKGGRGCLVVKKVIKK